MSFACIIDSVLERKKVNVHEMKCLRRLDRARNEHACRKACVDRELASRANQRVLRCGAGTG